MKEYKLKIAVLFVLCLFLTSFSFPLVLAAEDSWVSKAPLPLPSWGIVTLNNRIYAIAGSGNYNNETYSNNAVFEYDPDLNNWTLKDVMPIKRYSFALVAYQNRIYVIGEPEGLNQVYDPITDSWENRTSMPTPRTQLEANVVDGKIYLIAGRIGGANRTVALNEVYDPETDSWTTKTSIPFPVVQYASAVVDKKIYVIGGQDEYELPNPNLNITQIYDTITDTWTFGAPLPYVVWQADAGATAGQMAPKRIYVMGGLPKGSLFGTDLNQMYDTENNTWSLGSPMPIARAGLHIAVVNDVLYVLGGVPYINVQATWTSENYQYTPIGYIPEFPSWTPFLISGLIAALLMSIIYRHRVIRKG